MRSYKVVKAGGLPDTEALYPSDTIYSGVLESDTEQIVTIPTGAAFVVFSADTDFYVNYDTTAAVPTGTISQAGGELNPSIRFIADVTELHLASDSNCKLTINFFAR